MTEKQRQVLQELAAGPRTAMAVQHSLPDGALHDSARPRLRRLEDRGMVRRVWPEGAKVAWWELTEAGRAALELTA